MSSSAQRTDASPLHAVPTLRDADSDDESDTESATPAFNLTAVRAAVLPLVDDESDTELEERLVALSGTSGLHADIQRRLKNLHLLGDSSSNSAVTSSATSDMDDMYSTDDDAPLEIFGLGRIERGAGFTSARLPFVSSVADDASTERPVQSKNAAVSTPAVPTHSSQPTSGKSRRESNTGVDLAPFAKFFPRMPRFNVDDMLNNYLGDGSLENTDAASDDDESSVLSSPSTTEVGGSADSAPPADSASAAAANSGDSQSRRRLPIDQIRSATLAVDERARGAELRRQRRAERMNGNVAGASEQSITLQHSESEGEADAPFEHHESEQRSFSPPPSPPRQSQHASKRFGRDALPSFLVNASSIRAAHTQTSPLNTARLYAQYHETETAATAADEAVSLTAQALASLAASRSASTAAAGAARSMEERIANLQVETPEDFELNFAAPVRSAESSEGVVEGEPVEPHPEGAVIEEVIDEEEAIRRSVRATLKRAVRDESHESADAVAEPLPLTELQIQLQAEKERKEREHREAEAAADRRLAEQKRREDIMQRIEEENETDGELLYNEELSYGWPLAALPNSLWVPLVGGWQHASCDAHTVAQYWTEHSNAAEPIAEPEVHHAASGMQIEVIDERAEETLRQKLEQRRQAANSSAILDSMRVPWQNIGVLSVPLPVSKSPAFSSELLQLLLCSLSSNAGLSRLPFRVLGMCTSTIDSSTSTDRFSPAAPKAPETFATAARKESANKRVLLVAVTKQATDLSEIPISEYLATKLAEAALSSLFSAGALSQASAYLSAPVSRPTLTHLFTPISILSEPIAPLHMFLAAATAADNAVSSVHEQHTPLDFFVDDVDGQAARAAQRAQHQLASDRRAALQTIQPPKLHPIQLFSRPCSFFTFPLPLTQFNSLENNCAVLDTPLPFAPSKYESFVTVLKPDLLASSAAISACLNRCLVDEHLDILGLRVVYPSADQSHILGSRTPFTPQSDHPTVVLVLGGSNRALDRWLHAVGPTDPSLARQTDPQSLRAVFGGAERSSNLMHVQRAALMIGQDEQGDVLVGSHPSSFVNQHASEVVLEVRSTSTTMNILQAGALQGDAWARRDISFWCGGRVAPDTDSLLNAHSQAVFCVVTPDKDELDCM